MKAFCEFCDCIAPASFRPGNDATSGAPFEDLCCDQCHLVIATVTEREATVGVEACRAAQALPGLQTLQNVIECLRADARYVDEEGEATDRLQGLLDALRASGVAAVDRHTISNHTPMNPESK